VRCCLKMLGTKLFSTIQMSNIIRCIRVLSKSVSTVAKISFSQYSDHLYGMDLIRVLIAHAKSTSFSILTEIVMKTLCDIFMIICDVLTANRAIRQDMCVEVNSLLWTDDMLKFKIRDYDASGSDMRQTIVPEALLLTLLVNSENDHDRFVVAKSSCIPLLLKFMDTAEGDVQSYLDALEVYADEPRFVKYALQSKRHAHVLGAMHFKPVVVAPTGVRKLEKYKKKHVRQEVVVNEGDEARAERNAILLVQQEEHEKKLVQSPPRKRKKRKAVVQVAVVEVEHDVQDRAVLFDDAVVEVEVEHDVQDRAVLFDDAVVEVEVEHDRKVLFDDDAFVFNSAVVAAEEEGEKEDVVDITELTRLCTSCVHAECVICMEGDATHVFIPCGHQSLCETCVGVWTSRTCVTCRLSCTEVVSRRHIDFLRSLTEMQIMLFNSISVTDLPILQTQSTSISKQQIYRD
jgi:Zinc finger, C3HC4 type (RING finger)